MWHCNDSPSLRLVVLCMTDKSFVIFWTSVKMINGGMMPAGGAINIFSTLFWPIHYLVALTRSGRYHFGQTHEQASVVSQKNKKPVMTTFSWQT